MIHIGELIKEQMEVQGRTASWLAKSLSCTRINIYDIYKRNTIDTELLLKISQLLGYNFFQPYNDLIERDLAQ